MRRGWVYVLTNKSIPNKVKVGQTTRLPIHRAADLSSATGVAAPFELIWEQEFSDCVRAERGIHAILDRQGKRCYSNREFFVGPVRPLIAVIRRYAGDVSNDATCTLGQGAHELLEHADRLLHGDAETMRDAEQAVHYYHMAAQRGSIQAHERLGAILSHITHMEGDNRSAAISYLRHGAKQGNYYCHCELAAIAASDGNGAIFLKAWDSFFAQRAGAFNAEAELGDNRYVLALQRYVVTCFTLGIVPGHVAELTASAEPLIHNLAQTHRTLSMAAGTRRNLTVPLRWAYRTLLGRPYPEDQRWSLQAGLFRLFAGRPSAAA